MARAQRGYTMRSTYTFRSQLAACLPVLETLLPLSTLYFLRCRNPSHSWEASWRASWASVWMRSRYAAGSQSERTLERSSLPTPRCLLVLAHHNHSLNYAAYYLLTHYQVLTLFCPSFVLAGRRLTRACPTRCSRTGWRAARTHRPPAAGPAESAAAGSSRMILYIILWLAPVQA